MVRGNEKMNGWVVLKVCLWKKTVKLSMMVSVAVTKMLTNTHT